MELNLLFGDDDRICELNKAFRGKNEPTDILSFYGYEGNILGDIAISVDTLKKEALEKKIDIEEYTLFLIAHGFLHLLGYTHETMEKYNEMINMQNKLVKEFLK